MSKAKSKSQTQANLVKARTAQAYATMLELQELMGFRVIVHQVPKGTARKINYRGM